MAAMTIAHARGRRSDRPGGRIHLLRAGLDRRTATPSSRPATALWFGFDHLLDYLLYASLFGGALTIALINSACLPMPRLLVGQEWAPTAAPARRRRAFGIALAAAALCIYPDTSWMKAVAM